MIETRRLVKRYGVVTALAGLELEIGRGEAVRLVGKNGAGKSTLLRIIAGLERPTSGEASVSGFPVTSEGPRARFLCGYLPDRPHFYEELTPRENLRFFADLFRVRGDGRATTTTRLLRSLGLDGMDWKRSGALSRGQKQRLALACTLVHSPSVLLLDEPHAGLDEESSSAVDGVLAAEKGRGATLLVASHSHAPSWIDRTLRLEGGRLLGSPQTILHDGGVT